MSQSKSLDRGLAVLKLVLARGSISVAELTAALGVPAATVYRHVTALQRAGFVLRAKQGRLEPGLALLEHFDAPAFRARLAERARSLVEPLSDQFGLTAHLGAFDNEMVTYLVKAGATNALFTVENKQLDGYCSGLGKVLLAHLPQHEVDTYLAGEPFPRLTRNTITTAAALRKELRKIVADGFALDRQEFDEEVFCVAVPVHGPSGNVTAALSLSGPPDAFSARQRQGYLAALKGASLAITSQLTH